MCFYLCFVRERRPKCFYIDRIRLGTAEGFLEEPVLAPHPVSESDGWLMINNYRNWAEGSERTPISSYDKRVGLIENDGIVTTPLLTLYIVGQVTNGYFIWFGRQDGGSFFWPLGFIAREVFLAVSAVCKCGLEELWTRPIALGRRCDDTGCELVFGGDPDFSGPRWDDLFSWLIHLAYYIIIGHSQLYIRIHTI